MRIIIICNKGQSRLKFGKNTPLFFDLMHAAGEKMTAGTIQKSEKSLDSKTLFKGRSCIFIEHNGELYSLRITSNDKLILTK